MSESSLTRAAVVGTGHLGTFHAEKYAAIESCELVGVVDVDLDRVIRWSDFSTWIRICLLDHLADRCCCRHTRFTTYFFRNSRSKMRLFLDLASRFQIGKCSRSVLLMVIAIDTAQLQRCGVTSDQAEAND